MAGARLKWLYGSLVAIVVLVGLVAAPVAAQTDQYEEEVLAPEALAPGPDDQCPGAEVVATVGPTTDNATSSFEAAGATLRVTYQVQFVEEFSALDITIEDRFGVLQSEFIDESGTDSFIVVTEEPDAFDLITELSPANSGEYAVVVENCAGERAPPKDNERPGNGNNDGPGNVIEGSIPRKNLPSTSGPSLLLPTAGGLLLAGGLGVSLLRRR